MLPWAVIINCIPMVKGVFRKLGRSPSHRRALFRTMTEQLIVHERIKTTVAKAKELQHFADRIISYGKKGDQHSWNIAMQHLRTPAAASKLFRELAPRYANRDGGYTRIVRCGFMTNRAEAAYIEYVDNGKDPLRAEKIKKEPISLPTTKNIDALD
ncbi:putative 50S ribosomal protein L17 [Planoprotostelium fungivorum]|uniref:Putative 50S ribosomal protein L17 n=1 Tax=Planoprotostelium fungivorum TaxID=1890364 RepID=A0A2P6NJF3_9EUKA|nr:putative 50S ribosomal protein L17 [Planoprotostelium fungivorum]